MTDIIDMHCHMQIFHDGHEGYMNPIEYASYIRTRANCFLQKIPHGNRQETSRIYQERLLHHMERFAVNHFVLLPFDGVYENGLLDKKRTQWMIRNRTIIELSKNHPKIIPACSVNPNRQDWYDELLYSIENGAVLNKWIPGVMGIDPSDKRLNPFYYILADNNVCLLSHVDYEFALKETHPQYSGLTKLIPALERGVKVIVPHGGGGRPLFEDRTKYTLMTILAERFANLYFDISGMLSWHRRPRLMNVLKDDLISQRLVHGSDFPVPMFQNVFADKLAAAGLWLKANQSRNPFEKDLLVKKALGVSPKILSRGYKIIDQAKINKNSPA